MVKKIKKELDSYKKLSVAERIQLVQDIWDSIEAEDPESLRLTDAQKSELHRRIEAHKADPSSGIPWEKIRKSYFSAHHNGDYFSS